MEEDGVGHRGQGVGPHEGGRRDREGQPLPEALPKHGAIRQRRPERRGRLTLGCPSRAAARGVRGSPRHKGEGDNDGPPGGHGEDGGAGFPRENGHQGEGEGRAKEGEERAE